MSWPDGKIATQCLFKGGKAVYRARQYVQLFNDSIDFDNEIECSNQGYYRQVTDISNKTYISVSIIPNPTKDIATVILTGEDEGICDVQITNTLGQEKLKFKFNCKEREHILVLKDLMPGTYFVKTKVDSDNFFVNKIVIIR